MSALSAGSYLALWNGVNDPSLVAEYEAWHAFEHVPERVGVPGFLWAHRYVLQPGASGPAYFTLYGLETLDALEGPRYQELVDRPSDWSARMRGVLDDFCREPCEALSCAGVSTAAYLATLRVRVASREPVDAALQALVDTGHAVGTAWGRVSRRSAHPLSAQQAEEACGTPGSSGFDAVILVHHLRAELLQAGVRHLQGRLGDAVALRAPVGCHSLQSTVGRADLRDPPSSRQRPRPDLRQRFNTGDLLP